MDDLDAEENEEFEDEDIIRYYFYRDFTYEEIRRFLQKTTTWS